MTHPSAESPVDLPFSRSDQYWLCVSVPAGMDTQPVEHAFVNKGLKKLDENGHCYVLPSPGGWNDKWLKINELIAHLHIPAAEVAIIPGRERPSIHEIQIISQPVNVINNIAESMWFIEALQKNPIQCFFQPIVSRERKVYGYEAYARIKDINGNIIGGDKIIAASFALNIQHVIDKRLQLEAIKGFTQTGLEGLIFINFIPGFIRKASFYLEGLDQAIEEYGMEPGNIVLDITRSLEIDDPHHLKTIIDHCHARQYKVALDDIADNNETRDMVRRFKPDFVKLDQRLAEPLIKPANIGRLGKFIGFCHQNRCQVLAEGIESESMYSTLSSAGVDYFQGYHFGKPAPASAFSK